MDRPNRPLRCELKSPNGDLVRLWRGARLRGLSRELSSFTLQVLWTIIPTRDRLHQILPHIYASMDCTLCGTERQRVLETLLHALGTWEGNQGLPSCLLDLIRPHHPAITLHQVLKLDFPLDPSVELSVIWLTISTLLSIWKQRREGRAKLARTRAEVEANCRILRKGKTVEISNSFTLVSEVIRTMFPP